MIITCIYWEQRNGWDTEPSLGGLNISSISIENGAREPYFRFEDLKSLSANLDDHFVNIIVRELPRKENNSALTNGLFDSFLK